MSLNDSWNKKRLPIQWVEAVQLQGRAPLQEDRLAFRSDRGIFLIADGFGGSAGQQASELAVHSVNRFLEQEAGDLDATLPFELRSYFSLAGNILFNAISFANQKLMESNAARNASERGGASMVAGYLEGRLLAIASVGSCQVHLLRGGRIKEITNPKTLERQSDPFSEGAEWSVPLMSLGTVRQLEPEIIEVELQPGDRLCFSTSGVGRELRESLFQLNQSSEFSQWIQSAPNRFPIRPNTSAMIVSF